MLRESLPLPPVPVPPSPDPRTELHLRHALPPRDEQVLDEARQGVRDRGGVQEAGGRGRGQLPDSGGGEKRKT